jgi:hypothetical protein
MLIDFIRYYYQILDFGMRSLPADDVRLSLHA